MSITDLTPEQMKQAKDCKTSEELRELAGDTGHDLADDELEGIAGGIQCRPDTVLDFKNAVANCRLI